RFPDERLASFTVSFGAADMSSYSIVGRRGAITAQPAYDYTTDIRLQLSVGEQKSERTFPKRDQFAAEIDYFSDCIRNNREPEPDGQEGLIDVMIVEAIYESARAGKPVLVNLPRKTRRPDLSQSVYKPPVHHKPETVHVSSPSA
ncbi:MAG TPA: Gfo/Idh/MocA family oxidoreductase, partial [Bryobacteraceae bacterium]|nr:Gfo/Idh/MocA family oxidoreductase [Bryobacteraceae bacterium]